MFPQSLKSTLNMYSSKHNFVQTQVDLAWHDTWAIVNETTIKSSAGRKEQAVAESVGQSRSQSNRLLVRVIIESVVIQGHSRVCWLVKVIVDSVVSQGHSRVGQSSGRLADQSGNWKHQLVIRNEKLRGEKGRGEKEEVSRERQSEHLRG